MSASMVNPFLPESAIIPPHPGIEWSPKQQMSPSTAAAFESILAHDLDRLYRIAFRLLRNHEDAEDALQEGLWKAFRRLPSFEGRSSLSTWTTRIVINSALMTLRRRKSHLEFSLDEMMESQPEAVARRAADKRPNPEQMCAAAEFIKATKDQLLRLSDCEQAAFQHFVINGNSTKESAAAFGVPVPTFKSRICRTRRKLAQGMHHSPNKDRVAPSMGDVVRDDQLQ